MLLINNILFVFDRRRQIKRDLAGNVTDKKGIAGIRTTGSSGTTVSNTTATDTAVDDLSTQGNLFRGIDKKTVRRSISICLPMFSSQ